jgi:hypothetical protein
LLPHPTEPTKQFALLRQHIFALRQHSILRDSPVVIMVERNLGFEAEHHHNALYDIPNTTHRVDKAAKRYGILTTEEIKQSMMMLTNNMLRAKQINVNRNIVSTDPVANRRRLFDQLHIYSYQYKSAADVFGKQRCALSGKVGGMKDDVCIALQLCIYYSQYEHLYT